MWRAVVVFFIGVLGPVLGAAAPASAYAPSPTPAAPGDGTPAPTPSLGQAVCTIADPQMTDLSGLVATANGYVTMNDSNPNGDAIKVFFLDSACKRKSVVNYPAGTRARDPEDLAMQSDGTLWVADTGDNVLNPSRPNIALWKVPAGGTGKMTLFRFQYPDGAHDAEALLLAGDGSPIFVTKTPAGAAGVYVPAAPLDPSGKAVQLKKVGQFQPERTGTENPLGVAGQNSVTGGATSPDGKKVALRTYADAYEWDVQNGDVVNAITSGKPRITPLPREPFGEAIAYTADGTALLTVADQTEAVKILRYKPTATAVPAKVPAAAPPPRGDTRSWFDRLSLRQITYLVAGVGVLGLAFVLVGVLGIRRSRRQRRVAAIGTVRGTASVVSAAGSWSDEDEAGEPRAGRDDYADQYGDGIYAGGNYDDGYDQPHFDQPNYGQPGYGQPGHSQPGYGQPGYGQPEPPPGGYPQGGYSQGYDDYNPRSDYSPRR